MKEKQKNNEPCDRAQSKPPQTTTKTLEICETVQFSLFRPHHHLNLLHFFFLLCVQTFLRGVFRIQFGVVKVAGVPALEMQVIRDEGFQKVTGLARLVRDEEQFHKAVVGKLLV